VRAMTTARAAGVLDDVFLAHQASRVRDERAEAARVVDALASEVNSLLQRKLVNEPAEEGFGSGGTASFDLDQARARYAVAAAGLAEFDLAMARIAAGTYGCCDGCGLMIAEARLEAIPTATRCVTCQARRPHLG